MKKTRKIIICILGVIILLAFGAGIGAIHMGENAVQQRASKKKYERRYVMIVEKPDSVFWKNVYESACREAEENNAYVELMGDNLTGDYSLKDYMEIAISMKADGILLNTGDEKVQDMINQAKEENIPVITMMEDRTGSKRESFVGINTYQLGEMYANEIYKLIKKDNTKVGVLYDTHNETIENSMIYNQIKNVTNMMGAASRNMEVKPYNIADGTVFEKEEEIRNIFIQSENMADILVCMDEMETEYVYQAIVDYNYVGRVSLIGYYHSQNILDAIQKGLVAASLEPDAGQVGKKSITALTEYYETGYASDYYSVECNVITKENVHKYYDKND